MCYEPFYNKKKKVPVTHFLFLTRSDPYGTIIFITVWAGFPADDDRNPIIICRRNEVVEPLPNPCIIPALEMNVTFGDSLVCLPETTSRISETTSRNVPSLIHVTGQTKKVNSIRPMP